MCVGLVVFLGCLLGTVGNKIGTKSLSLIEGTKFTTGQGEKAEAADFLSQHHALDTSPASPKRERGAAAPSGRANSCFPSADL